MGNACFKGADAVPNHGTGPSPSAPKPTFSAQQQQQPATTPGTGIPAPAKQGNENTPSPLDQIPAAQALYASPGQPAEPGSNWSDCPLGSGAKLAQDNVKYTSKGSSNSNTVVTVNSNGLGTPMQSPEPPDPGSMNIMDGARESNSSVLNTKLPPPKLSVAGGAAGLVKGIDSLGGGICSSFSFLRDRALSLHPASNGGDLGTPQASLNGTIAGLLGGTDSPMSVMSGRAHDRLGSWTQQSEHSGVGTSASSSMPASDHGALLQQSTEAQQKLRQMSVRELNDEIQELTFIGQGASGDVYRGQWQGATVAVKYIISANEGNQEAAAREAVLGRLLAHPNVVQTFSCKVVLLDEDFFTELADLVAAHQQTQAEAAADDMDGPGMAGGMIGDCGDGQSTVRPGAWGLHAGATFDPDDKRAMVANSFMSGEGFGNPLARPANVIALQEVLVRANARPGHLLTQIVMDHCDKGSLLQAIKRGLFRPTSKWGSKLALRALLRTAREVAQGMWHIHSSNVIHGDLKPGNVLLKGSRADRRGFVAKVSDFGLARVCEKTMTDSGHWGTVHYMAPESFEGTLTRDMDVYAFGVTLWQMVTGEKPYGDLHPGQVIVGVQTDTLHLDWPPDTHPRLLKLGLACLAHDRKKRPNFNYIMKELSLIESMVRLEGTRDGGGSSDRVSSGVRPPQPVAQPQGGGGGPGQAAAQPAAPVSGSGSTPQPGSPFTSQVTTAWVNGPGSDLNSSSSLTFPTPAGAAGPGAGAPSTGPAAGVGPTGQRISSSLNPNLSLSGSPANAAAAVAAAGASPLQPSRLSFGGAAAAALRGGSGLNPSLRSGNVASSSEGTTVPSVRGGATVAGNSSAGGGAGGADGLQSLSGAGVSSSWGTTGGVASSTIGRDSDSLPEPPAVTSSS